MMTTETETPANELPEVKAVPEDADSKDEEESGEGETKWTDDRERTIQKILHRHSWIERRGTGVQTRLFCKICISANVGGRWATTGSQRVRTSVGNEHTQAAVHERAVNILRSREGSQMCLTGMPSAEAGLQAGDTGAMAHTLLRTPRPTWLDCDPGHDDAMAIILCGYNPHVRLLGISTVAGNQTVEKTTENALRILHLAGLADSVKVVQGAGQPLLRPRRHCPEIHGHSGLDGPPIPPAKRRRLDGKAVTVMYESILQAYREWGQGRVVIVATGALTNIALLLRVYPEVVDMIEVVVMGGSNGRGNTGPVAEFNMQCDPEAACIVLNSGAFPISPTMAMPPERIPVTVVPLEVTHTAIVTSEVLARIRGATPSPFRVLMTELLTFFAETYRREFGFEQGPPLHDPCAAAFVVMPMQFQVCAMRVDVECHSELSAGQTVCDIWRKSPLGPNVRWCSHMNVERFWDLMVDAIERADAKSPMNASMPKPAPAVPPADVLKAPGSNGASNGTAAPVAAAAPVLTAADGELAAAAAELAPPAAAPAAPADDPMTGIQLTAN